MGKRADFLRRPPWRHRLKAYLRTTWPARAHWRRVHRRDGDVFLLSFPKAGRTWLRVLLARAMARHCDIGQAEIGLELEKLPTLRPGLPRIVITHDDDPQEKAPWELVSRKSEYRDVKVILLVRDLRDLVVSTYFHMSRREKRYDLELSRFLHNPRGSVDTMLRFYNIWAANRDVPAGFLLVRYEDLHAHTTAELRRILEFVGLSDVAEATLAEAATFASFERMREMERKDEFHSVRLRPGDPADEESYKTRKGKVGGFTEYLKPDEIAWLDGRIRAELSPLYGYG